MDVLRSDFIAAASALVGVKCWGVSAGNAHRFALMFGAKFARDSLVPNEQLSPDARAFQAEYDLFVQSCPWRLWTQDAVIATWDDDDRNDGPLVTSLERLVGKHVVSSVVRPTAWDLELSFDNGWRLSLFPDSSPRSEFDDYDLATPTTRFTITRGGEISVEPRVLDHPGHRAETDTKA